jgi:hypothetical protein
MNTRVLVASAFAAAIAAPSLLSAQKPAEMPRFKAEKCYGIAKAGKNDCASAGNNSCDALVDRAGCRILCDVSNVYLSAHNMEDPARHPLCACGLGGRHAHYDVSRNQSARFVNPSAFREAVSRGHSIGDAAGYALALDDAFDPGRALLVLLNERLITAIEPQLAGGRL